MYPAASSSLAGGTLFSSSTAASSVLMTLPTYPCAAWWQASSTLSGISTVLCGGLRASPPPSPSSPWDIGFRPGFLPTLPAMKAPSAIQDEEMPALPPCPAPPPAGAQPSHVTARTMECGGKRSATPLWASQAMLPFRLCLGAHSRHGASSHHPPDRSRQVQPSAISRKPRPAPRPPPTRAIPPSCESCSSCVVSTPQCKRAGQPGILRFHPSPA